MTANEKFLTQRQHYQPVTLPQDFSQACRYLVIDFGTSQSPYMVSSRFARLNNPNDRDKIASIYPACLRRMWVLLASMKFAHTILIKISVFINFGDFQVFNVPVLPVVSSLVTESSQSLAGYLSHLLTLWTFVSRRLINCFLNNHRPTYTSHFIC